MTDPDALEGLAVRAATAAAELDTVEHLEARSSALNHAERQALADRRTCVELELAEIAAELRALDDAGG